MESPESYRTSVLPGLSARGANTARVFFVAGPAVLLLAQLATSLSAVQGLSTVLAAAAVPLMLAWAAVLFLVTRAVSPVTSWLGLVAVTLQLTFVQQVADTWLQLTVETVGFVAFAVALWPLWWVPRSVPVLLALFPVVDVLTPQQSNLVVLVVFALFVAASLVLARRMSLAVDRPPVRYEQASVVRVRGTNFEPSRMHRPFV
jgi:hypothetical protein